MKTLFNTLIVAGIILRFIFAVTTYHQDLGAISLSGKYIVVDGLWTSFYDKSGQDVSKTIFNYQPLAYLIPAVSYLPFKGYLESIGDTFVNADWMRGYPSFINFNLLLYKLPMILADLACLFLIAKFFVDKKLKKLAQLFWALNPVVIFVSSVLGQVDIFIALLLMLGYYNLKNGKLFTSILLVSLSALIKPIGLILLPFFILPKESMGQSLVSSLRSVFLGGVIYVVGILPFLHSNAYKHYALFADQIGKSTFAGISISAGTVIPFFFIGLVLSYFLYTNNKKTLLSALLLALMSSLFFTNFHPQWLVWLIPFLVIYCVQSLNSYQLIITSLAWVIILISFDNSLHLGSFINSNLDIPASVRSIDLFTQLTLLARAVLVAQFIWLMSLPKEQKT